MAGGASPNRVAWRVATFVLASLAIAEGALALVQHQRTQAQLAAASQPDLPLRLSFCSPAIAGGTVGVLENFSDSTLEVTLDIGSPASGVHFRRGYIIKGRAVSWVSRLQGFPFAPGQIVTVSNPRYRPITQTVGS